jgi:hypothetical protein
MEHKIKLVGILTIDDMKRWQLWWIMMSNQREAMATNCCLVWTGNLFSRMMQDPSSTPFQDFVIGSHTENWILKKFTADGNNNMICLWDIDMDELCMNVFYMTYILKIDELYQ